MGYFDTSALVKRYYEEGEQQSSTRWSNGMTRPS